MSKQAGTFGWQGSRPRWHLKRFFVAHLQLFCKFLTDSFKSSLPHRTEGTVLQSETSRPSACLLIQAQTAVVCAAARGQDAGGRLGLKSVLPAQRPDRRPLTGRRPADAPARCFYFLPVAQFSFRLRPRGHPPAILSEVLLLFFSQTGRT